MIILDTETSRWKPAEAAPLDQQPEIIELAMVKLDDATLKEVDSFSSLFKPRYAASPEVLKFTGISDADLTTAPSFAGGLNAIRRFVFSETFLVAHHCAFDVAVLAYELQRLGYQHRFPWPPEHIDTVELTMDLPAVRQRSARLKLGDLYLELMGEPMPKAHRALDDARALAACVRKLRALDGRI